MMNFTAQPEQTFALVVGIAKYQESSWNITSGATVKDALKFACWLHERGVPASNIKLCLSPLKENQELINCGLSVEHCTLESIINIIYNFLSKKTGDLLYIFWAGHGLITSERERRLLCADATEQNWQNIDLHTLLLLLSSESFQIRNHICIIDACANYLLESEGGSTNLGGVIFNSGKPRTDSQSFVLFATREGEKAKVSAQSQTGYFSQAVLSVLKNKPSEPFVPDMKDVAQEVKQQVVSLNKTQQPTYFYSRSWDGEVEKDYININPFEIPQNVPSSSTNKFVGREEQLEKLNQKLQRHGEVVIVAVEGMGGVGKTELAIQYSLSHLHSRNYPGGIFWLQARDSDIASQILSFASTYLGLQSPDYLKLPEEKVRWCWNNWKPQGNTLVVLDDVTNYIGIKPYLPPQLSQFKVLITTRLKLNLPGSLYCSVLSSEDAILLLTQLVGKEKVNQEKEKATELCQRLGNLPLALQLVGRYVKKRNISLSEMLRRLENKGLGHGSLVVNQNDPTWTLDIKRGVQAAFELNWSELNKSAQELGCLLSLFAASAIPWSLLEKTVSQQEQEDLEDAREELKNLHLLQSDDTNTYQLHQLIREFLSDKLDNLSNADEQKYNFCKAMVKEAENIYSSPTITEDIQSLQNTIPHLEELGRRLISEIQKQQQGQINSLPSLFFSEVIWVFIVVGKFYQGQGLYKSAEAWYEDCLTVCKVLFTSDHAYMASSLNYLGGIYRYQGHYIKAKPCYDEALKMRKRLYNGDHPDVVSSLNNLALLYFNQKRYSEAETFYVEALEMTKRLYNGDHSDVAITLTNLALLYRSQNRLLEAESFYVDALEMFKRLYSGDHPNVAQSLNNLAVFYHSQKQHAKAESFYVKALKMRKRLHKEEKHPSVAESLYNLALLYYNQGRHHEAEHLYTQALEIYKRVLGENHPTTVKVQKILKFF